MAQRAHAHGIRHPHIHDSIFQCSGSIFNYTKNMKQNLLMLDFTKRFYKRCGYNLIHPTLSRNGLETHLFFELIPTRQSKKIFESMSSTKRISAKIARVRKKKEVRPLLPYLIDSLGNNSLPFPLVTAEPSQKSVRRMSLTRKLTAWRVGKIKSFYWLSKRGSSWYKWNAEKHILSKVLFRVSQSYPFLIKSNFFANHLSPFNAASSDLVASHLQEQIELSSTRRQRVHMKSYLDKFIEDKYVVQHTSGIRIQIKGRYSSGGGGKAGRAKKDLSSWGNIPLQTLSSFIDYSYVPIRTKLGLCSAKVWIHHSDPTQEEII